MTRGRLRAATAILAVAILGLLAWLLWPRTTPGGTRAGPESGTSSAQVSRSDTQGRATLENFDADPAAAAPPAGEPSRAESGGDADLSTRSIKGVCELEDGKPLAGVRFTYMLSTGTDLLSSVGPTSDAEGRFEALGDERLARDGRTLDQRTQVDHPFADLVSAEGAEILAREEGATTGTRELKALVEPVRLVFRDRAGTAHVRLVNADTNEPVTNVEGLRVAYRLPSGSLSYGFPDDTGLGGWISIPEGRVPEVGPDPEAKNRDVAGLTVDPEKVEVEFAMPGFEMAKLPLPDIRGRMEVRVLPVPADATGEVGIVIPKGDGTIVRLTSRIRNTMELPPQSKAGIVGLPTGLGRFSVYNLPDGSWEIEVAAELAGGSMLRAKKVFEKRGAPIDLGKIELRASGMVAITVMDSTTAPIPQAWAVIVRPEENPDQARRLEVDQFGRAKLGDLEPGATHRVIVKGLPRDMEQTAIARESPEPLEFRWPEKLVFCRITLVVDGKVVANADGKKTIPAVVQESPLPRGKGAWGSDGTFEAKLVPGTYKFSALATPKEGGDMALFSGEVTVPAGDAFETRLELRREGR